MGAKSKLTILAQDRKISILKGDNQQLLEEELKCCICMDVYIHATALDCGHMFCSKCIEDWMQNQHSCPQCRTKVKKCIRTKAIDSYIDKFSNSFASEEFKNSR